jgi:hypothetical protein
MAMQEVRNAATRHTTRNNGDKARMKRIRQLFQQLERGEKTAREIRPQARLNVRYGLQHRVLSGGHTMISRKVVRKDSADDHPTGSKKGRERERERERECITLPTSSRNVRGISVDTSSS